MECKICGSVQIKGDCQYINGYYYHNYCIEKLAQENNQLKELLYTKNFGGDIPRIISIFGEMDKARIEKLENIIKDLRSWLKEKVFNLNSIFDRDIYEEQMMLDFSNILLKLNELEEGKNDS